MLQQTFTSLCTRYTNNGLLITELWLEIEKNYCSKDRYYHNLQHLENMLMQLEEHKDMIEDWDIALFSLFYHDIIYSPTAKDNEEKSAVLAVKRLSVLGCSNETAEKSSQLILATKSHSFSHNRDINIFTDADLSILGSSWEKYYEYAQQVRKEYSIYPDILYKPGRRKVIQHFLEMPHIFKTTAFIDKFEQKARENLIKELDTL